MKKYIVRWSYDSEAETNTSYIQSEIERKNELEDAILKYLISTYDCEEIKIYSITCIDFIDFETVNK
jgi:hypothetical protein